MKLWSAKDVRKRCEQYGFTITNENLCLWLACLLNEQASRPNPTLPSNQDCAVVWNPGWRPE